MPDLQRIGGLTEFRRAANLASSFDVPVSSHIFTEQSLSIAGSVSNTHAMAPGVPNQATEGSRASASRSGTTWPTPGRKWTPGPKICERSATMSTMKQVLIVDDELKISRLVRDYLHEAGFATLEASDGETALALARAERPEMIVLDLGLPGIDGLDVARQLRMKKPNNVKRNRNLRKANAINPIPTAAPTTCPLNSANSPKIVNAPMMMRNIFTTPF